MAWPFAHVAVVRGSEFQGNRLIVHDFEQACDAPIIGKRVWKQALVPPSQTRMGFGPYNSGAIRVLTGETPGEDDGRAF
jgi:hypothetical protein